MPWAPNAGRIWSATTLMTSATVTVWLKAAARWIS